MCDIVPTQATNSADSASRINPSLPRKLSLTLASSRQQGPSRRSQRLDIRRLIRAGNVEGQKDDVQVR